MTFFLLRGFNILPAHMLYGAEMAGWLQYWHARQTGSEVCCSWSLASRVWVHFLCQSRVKTLAQGFMSSGGWRASVLSGDEVPRHGRWMRAGWRDQTFESINGRTERYPACMKVLVFVHMGVCIPWSWPFLCVSLQLTGASCCSNCLFIARQRRPLAQGRQTRRHFKNHLQVGEERSSLNDSRGKWKRPSAFRWI